MARYEEWIYRAKSALEMAQLKLVNYPCYEDLCFQIQQSAEKALKGLLIYYGVEPEFTHNIEILIDELIKFTDIPENIKATTDLTIYAVTTRYPGEYDEITKAEYEKSVKIAQECVEWVENRIKEIESEKNKTR
jgi:HEPN domain-containing protein